MHRDSTSHSMDNNRFGFPHRAPQDEYLQYRPKRSALDAGAAIRGTSAGMNLTDPLSGKFNEKELMHGLNDRLAGFIEKVHHLQHQNQLLETEIEEIRGKAKPASCLEEEYGPELRKLRQLVQDITHQKHQIEVEHQNLEDELSNLRRRYEQEARSRSDAEGNIEVLKRDMSDAYRAKLQLDKKAQALVDEIHFLKETHEAEVSEMFDQIQNAQVTVKAHDFGNPGVTAALRDIRAQLEGHAVSDLQQVGETFRSQFARLTEVAETKREALKASQQEIQEYRRRLQAKNIEMDCAKGTREALEKQLHDVEDRQKEEIIHYQNTIKELENELINCKFDMSGYLREYQDLLNVKMALDVEILSYRKLLCGEEARLSSISDTHISLPYIYHQSPVYTLPCFSRPGGPHRRAEPQYKFVEEIITETTREIEMSEFEETGSEETEAGKDEEQEEEGAKRDKGSSEEEEDNKNGREEEGDQLCDSEQNQVASVKGEDDGNPGEGDDGEKGQENKEEEEADDVDGDRGVDKNNQSKVLVSESLDEEENEQHKKAAESTKEEKEAAVTTATVQKELSSKAEELLTKSDEGKKGDAEKDNFVTAQAKKPVGEISGQVSDKTSGQVSASASVKESEEISSAQVEVHTSASETAEKTTAETESAVSTETEELSEKAQVSSSTTPKSEEKETEPKEIRKSEAAEAGDKVANGTQDARDDSNKGQDKELSLKSGEKSLPGGEDQKPNSGEETQTVQTVVPKEKTTVNEEIKESHQGAAESSQVQKSKPSEVSEKINDPQGTSEKVESSKSEK